MLETRCTLAFILIGLVILSGVSEVPGVFELAASAVPGAQSSPSRRDADLMKQKVLEITEFASKFPAPGGVPAQPHRTTVTERELNAYLTYEAPEELPAGVVNPSVTMVGDGRVSARAVVDLDAVRKQRKSGGLLDPTSYLSGRLPVTVTGVLRTTNGTGRFELESTTLSGVPIPKTMLQQIVGYYSRTPQNPSGITLDDSFDLPARIREIRLDRGQAIVVQ